MKNGDKKKKKNALTKGFIILFMLIILIFTAFLIQKPKTEKQQRLDQINNLTSEALLEFPKDNTTAIQIAGTAHKKGLPEPPARTCEVLSSIGYSSYNQPFYIAEVKHDKEVYTAVFSPDNRYILTASEDKTAKL